VIGRGLTGRLAASAVVAACARPPAAAPANAGQAGLAIAIYAAGAESYGVVDDRRWVDVAGDALVLDQIEPGAELASLVIEPLDGDALAAGACLRDRIPHAIASGDSDGALDDVAVADTSAATVTPVLRCAVHAAPGRHLVRLLYVVPGLGYRVQHDVTMRAPDRASVVSRYAIATPAWHVRAELTLFDRKPGAERAPRALARGTVVLDGGTAVIAEPPRELAARLLRIYEHAMDTSLGAAPSHSAVWCWLELDGTTLAPGPVRAHLELAGEAVRDVVIPAAGRRDGAATGVRLPLWIEPQLYGQPTRVVRGHRDGATSDRLDISIANTGEVTREVWLETSLRSRTRRASTRGWPGEPIINGDRLRLKLIVPGGKIERGGFELGYEP